MRVHCAWLLAVVFLVGCGDDSDLERAIISGKVTHRGRSVDDGLIRFVPIKGAKGPPAGSVIKNGTYEVKAIGGVPEGVCRVEIKGFRTRTRHNRPPGFPDVKMLSAKEQYIPKRYNKESTLEVTIGSEEEKVQDFNLE